jgi:hypothetical protein
MATLAPLNLDRYDDRLWDMLDRLGANSRFIASRQGPLWCPPQVHAPWDDNLGSRDEEMHAAHRWVARPQNAALIRALADR